MPQVPIYNRQVQDRAISAPNFRPQATLETFGAGEASDQTNRAIGQLQNTVGKIADEQTQRADDAATTEAYTKLLQAKQDMLYNPDNGAFTKKGKDAFGISQEYGTRYDQVAESISSGLNSRQRAVFEKMRQKEGLELNGHLQRHTLQEAERYEDQQTTSAIDVLQKEAALNPVRATEAIALMQGKIQDFAEKTGKPSEWTIDRLQNETSKAHSGVVSSFLGNKQYGLAKKYFNENKDGLIATDRDRLRTAIDEGDRREFGEFKAASLMSKGVTIQNLQQELDKIGDVEKRDETKRRFIERSNLQEASQKKSHDNLVDYSYKTAIEAGTKDAVNPELWMQLDPKEKQAIEKEIHRTQQGIPAGTDWGTKNFLAELAEKNPKKFLQENPLTYFSDLSEADRNWYLGLRKDIEKEGKSSALDDYRTESSIVTRSLKEAGLDKISDKDRGIFEDSLAQAQRKKQAQDGKKLSNTEFQMEVDKQLMEVRTGKFLGIFNKSSRTFELDPGQQGTVDDVSQIPDRVQKQIKDALFVRKGIKDPSEDMILRVYKESLSAN